MAMNAIAKHPRSLYAVCLVLVVILAAAVFATPKYADPPVGLWSGTLDDGRTVTLTLIEDGGIRLDGVLNAPFLGTWAWTPLSATAGTLHCEPADWRDHPPGEYNVNWRAPMRIELSNSAFTVVLNRTI
jgi:hypothetical protein